MKKVAEKEEESRMNDDGVTLLSLSLSLGGHIELKGVAGSVAG